jgi:hypothetical protein
MLTAHLVDDLLKHAVFGRDALDVATEWGG